jgi:hypothetical protein
MNLGDIFIFFLPIFHSIFSTHVFIIAFWLLLTTKKYVAALGVTLNYFFKNCTKTAFFFYKKILMLLQK